MRPSERRTAFGLDALDFGGEASDPDYAVVRTTEDLEGLGEEILGERDYPIVGLTLRVDSSDPVLRASDVRSALGAGPRIYLIEDEELSHSLSDRLGGGLRICSGAVRVWWPGASEHSDPDDHPLVVGLEDEDYRVTLEELAHEFDLSRPRVRGHVRVIEDSRAFLQDQLSEMHEQGLRLHERLRDAQIEAHRLRTRLERAEASLHAAAQLPSSTHE
jgi:hypothetical protein